jgi:drug/metabolite transporter (DMT)-like permease
VQPALVWAALITVYVLWGSTYLGIRVAVQTMPPFLMAGVRFLIAGALLCAWRFPAAARAGKLPTRDEWRRTLVIGAALLLGGNGAVAYAETSVPSGLTALMVSVVPLWMALIDRIFYGRRLPAPVLAGLFAGFAGVALLVGPPGRGSISLVGALVLTVGSLSWAAGSLYSRGARLPEDSLLATGMEMLTGGACLTLAGIAAGETAHVQLAAISSNSWIAFVYLIFFGGIAGFSAYLWVIRNAPTSLVSTYAYVNPVVAVFLGWAILHETLTLRTLAAAAVIVCSVAWIVSANSRK